MEYKDFNCLKIEVQNKRMNLPINNHHVNFLDTNLLLDLTELVKFKIQDH
ncbi:MAG: hypothetical protein ACTSWY_14310 [Promethearchaeota archaeon]